MNRLLVALLAAFDAAIAAVVGLAAALAPLTVLWVFGLGGGADWGALWTTAGRVWQLGNLVPVEITLPAEYLAATGLTAEVGTFTLSLAPLAFAAFTLLFAARSGARAAQAGAWVTGVVAGFVTALAAAAAVQVTTATDVAVTAPAAAIAAPALLYGAGALLGALVHAWRHGDDGIVDDLRDRLDRHPQWAAVPAAAGVGVGVILTGMLALGAAAFVIALVARGGEVIALYEQSHVDALGATMLFLGQLAFVPTLVVWAASWIAGPGFAVGVGTTVSPAGAQLGALPGVPVLGALPAGGTPGLLLVALLVVALAVAGGWAARARLIAAGAGDAAAPRAVTVAVIVAVSAAVAAIAAWMASGSIGPDRLVATGPHAGWLALAVGVEVAAGAAILLLSPTREADAEGRDAPDALGTPASAPDDEPDADGADAPASATAETAPLDDLRPPSSRPPHPGRDAGRPSVD